jgi:hypothetical protein
MIMTIDDKYESIANRLEGVICDLDKLGLQNIAVHVDLALRRFEELLANNEPLESKNESIL